MIAALAAKLHPGFGSLSHFYVLNFVFPFRISFILLNVSSTILHERLREKISTTPGCDSVGYVRYPASLLDLWS
jgi:hypothetical protein